MLQSDMEIVNNKNVAIKDFQRNWIIVKSCFLDPSKEDIFFYFSRTTK